MDPIDFLRAGDAGQTVHSRHVVVQQHEVIGPFAFKQFLRPSEIGGLMHFNIVFMRHECAQRIAQQFVIVSNQDSHNMSSQL